MQEDEKTKELYKKSHGYYEAGIENFITIIDIF